MDFRLWHRRFCALKFAAGNGTIKIKISLPSGRGVPEVCIRDLFSSQLRQKHGQSPWKPQLLKLNQPFVGYKQLQYSRMNKHVKWCKNAKEAWLETICIGIFWMSHCQVRKQCNLHGPWHCRQASAFCVTAGSAWGRVRRAAWWHRGRRPLMDIKKPMTRLGKMGCCHI